MEKPDGEHFFAPILLTEIFGSCLFMLSVNLAGDETIVVPLTYFALIICTYEVSGGYLNPAVTVGAYIGSKGYVKHLLFMCFICLAQCFGALLALGFGYLLRVTVNRKVQGEQYLEPNVYASAPPLLLTTDGMPCYGQMMLAETIAAFILVLTSVTIREHMKKRPKKLLVQGALSMAVALAAVNLIFREISGGIANPAIALAKIIWQEFTLKVDVENDNSQWTYEYALSFIMGPFCGAYLAGVVFNALNYHAKLINDYVPKSKRDALQQMNDQNNLSTSQISISQSMTSNN